MEKLCRKCTPKVSPRPLFNFGKQPKTATAFIEKSYRKCTPKFSPRPLFNFGKQPKTAIACEKFF